MYVLHGPERDDWRVKYILLSLKTIHILYYVLFYYAVILFRSQRNVNWPTQTCQSFFVTITTNEPPAFYESDFYVVILSIRRWMNARMSNAVVRVTECSCVRFAVPQNGYDPHVDISVIRRNTAGPWARLALENTKAFSLTARIVLKDDLRARARARLRLNAKRWKLNEASTTRGFSYLKVNNWRSTITATFLPLTWQFYANFIATWWYRGGDVGGAL